MPSSVRLLKVYIFKSNCLVKYYCSDYDILHVLNKLNREENLSGSIFQKRGLEKEERDNGIVKTLENWLILVKSPLQFNPITPVSG